MGKRKTLNEFIENANNVHNGKYDYCNVKYKDVFTKVKIICPIHGEFEQIPKSHLKGHGCRCCKTSKGEKIISEFLKCNNIKYLPQYKFPDCKNIRPLPFDFYLPDLNICIEYDGEQHFLYYNNFWGGKKNLLETQYRDNIKTKYCNGEKW